MDERQPLDRLRVAELRDESAMRHVEQRMAREERRMAGEMKQLEAAEKAVEHEVEQEWRREHWGHEPERPPAWEAADGDREQQEQRE